MNSCSNQNKIDLDKATLNKNTYTFFKDSKTFLEAREINTTLSMRYTTNVELYKYGTVDFVNSEEKNTIDSKVGLLLETQSAEKYVGFFVTVEDTEISKLLLEELIKKNGNPKVLLPVPLENEDKELLGYSAYLWQLKNDTSIVLSQSYEYTNGKRTIASLLYIISNTVTVSKLNENELVIDRLIRTYN